MPALHLTTSPYRRSPSITRAASRIADPAPARHEPRRPACELPTARSRPCAGRAFLLWSSWRRSVSARNRSPLGAPRATFSQGMKTTHPLAPPSACSRQRWLEAALARGSVAHSLTAALTHGSVFTHFTRSLLVRESAVSEWPIWPSTTPSDQIGHTPAQSQLVIERRRSSHD